MKLRKEDFTKLMFGITALILGVLFLCCAFEVIEFKQLLPYWTLFIIIPTVGSMIANGVNVWKTALLALGINALICQSHWGDWHFRQFLAANGAVILILVGVLLIFGNPKSEGIFQRMNRSNNRNSVDQENIPPYH